MPIVTLLNQKGGVGKTSTCFHLAGTLAKEGLRVLLVDNDPQASLSQGFLGSLAALGLEPEATVSALYRGLDPFAEQLVRPTGVPGVDLLAGSAAAGRFNLAEPFAAEPALQRCLADWLPPVAAAYDWTLIDCPPNLHLCSWAALAASTHLVVPLQPEDFGVQGVGPVLGFVEQVRPLNPTLRTLGLLITMFLKGRSTHLAYRRLLEDAYGPLVFEQVVPSAEAFRAAVTRNLPVSNSEPSSAAAGAMRRVADELRARLTLNQSPDSVEVS